MAANAKQGVKIGVQVKRPLKGKKREIPEQLKRLILANKWDQWEFQERELTGADLKSYLRLRQCLDAFELIAVNYYLAGDNLGDRDKRAEKVVNFIKEFVGDANGGDCDCPVGMYCCNG